MNFGYHFVFPSLLSSRIAVSASFYFAYMVLFCSPELSSKLFSEVRVRSCFLLFRPLLNLPGSNIFCECSKCWPHFSFWFHRMKPDEVFCWKYLCTLINFERFCRRKHCVWIEYFIQPFISKYKWSVPVSSCASGCTAVLTSSCVVTFNVLLFRFILHFSLTLLCCYSECLVFDPIAFNLRSSSCGK
jgi:hypothetical protein